MGRTLAVPKIVCLLFASHNFDRYAISPLLHPPQAACGLNVTNSATPANINAKCKVQSAKCKIISKIQFINTDNTRDCITI